jgi:restriction system protein
MDRRERELRAELRRAFGWHPIFTAFAAALVLMCAGVLLAWVLLPLSKEWWVSIFDLLGFLALMFVVDTTSDVMASRSRLRKLWTLETTKTIEDLNSISWKRFGLLVAAVLNRNNVRVDDTLTGASAVETLVYYNGKGRHAVACIQCGTRKIDAQAIREFHLALPVAHAKGGGIVVAAGEFADGARTFAESRSIRLIDGEELLAMIRAMNDVAPAVPHVTPVWIGSGMECIRRSPAPLTCPKCGIPMVVRAGRAGINGGRTFFGCPNFPECREICDEFHKSSLYE